MLCHRGCGLKSTYLNYKGLPCCNKSHNVCPVVAEKKSNAQKGKAKPSVSIALTGRKLNEQHKKNIGKSHTGKITSLETIEKIRKSNIQTKQNQLIIPWNKGITGVQVAWNKGLKKQEPIEVLLRNDPIYSDFKKYRNRVAVRTKKIYEEFKEEINPTNLPIGKCGIDGAYQIDHIISVREGFEKGLSVESISSKENLQMLPWLENIQKYDGKGLRKSSKG